MTSEEFEDYRINREIKDKTGNISIEFTLDQSLILLRLLGDLEKSQMIDSVKDKIHKSIVLSINKLKV